MEINLRGKNAVVTGATGELGRCIAKSLAGCGANVAICYYKNKDMAFALKSEIEKEYKVRALDVCADVTDFESVSAMQSAVKKELGPVDIIINNAVVQYDWTTVLKQDIEDYESQFKSCVMHNVYMAKAFVPDMIEREYGRVIAINTECAMQNFPTQSAYTSGKRGMDGLLRVLAREVGHHNITVNQVAPGWVISDKHKGHTDGGERNTNQDFPYIERVPMGQRVTDKDIANAVCFLASDLARFITGLYLPVCGGNVMTCI